MKVRKSVEVVRAPSQQSMLLPILRRRSGTELVRNTAARTDTFLCGLCAANAH